MCDLASAQIAMAIFKVGTTIQDFQSKQAIARNQEAANEQTRKNSDQAYLYDLSKIDAEVVSASREKKAEEFKLQQEANKKAAQNLNLNAGNPDKIIQDIAGTADMQFLDITRDYEADISKASGQEKEAYAAQLRRYNSIAPVVMPSRTGLLFQIGTQAATGYSDYKKAQSPTK